MRFIGIFFIAIAVCATQSTGDEEQFLRDIDTGFYVRLDSDRICQGSGDRVCRQLGDRFSDNLHSQMKTIVTVKTAVDRLLEQYALLGHVDVCLDNKSTSDGCVIVKMPKLDALMRGRTYRPTIDNPAIIARMIVDEVTDVRTWDLGRSGAQDIDNEYNFVLHGEQLCLEDKSTCVRLDNNRVRTLALSRVGLSYAVNALALVESTYGTIEGVFNVCPHEENDNLDQCTYYILKRSPVTLPHIPVLRLIVDGYSNAVKLARSALNNACDNDWRT